MLSGLFFECQSNSTFISLLSQIRKRVVQFLKKGHRRFKETRRFWVHRSSILDLQNGSFLKMYNFLSLTRQSGGSLEGGQQDYN